LLNKQIIHYFIIGLGQEADDSTLPATESIVFMAVAANGSWKIPLAYFLIASLNGEEKSRLITICLKKLYDIDIKSVGITCDGLSSNFAAFRLLGANFDVSNMKSFFPHPSDPNLSVAVIIDACHVIKLIRNTLSDLQVLKDQDGNQIRYLIKKIKIVFTRNL
jgi:hypothetical protein